MFRSGRAAMTPAERAAIVHDFKQAWPAKDVNALIGLLDPDATARADGGGRASNARSTASPAWSRNRTASP
jgi:hypothetical protein